MGRQEDSSLLLEYMREGHMKEGMRHKILTPLWEADPSCVLSVDLTADPL